VNTKSIQNFILQSEENFRIAAAVAQAWPEARRQLMSSFLDRLETRLRRKLKGWKTFRDPNFFKTYAGYYITKTEWGESYWIGFECYPNLRQIDIGIMWETGNIRKQAPTELLPALQTIYPSAKYIPAHRWVYAMLRSPEPDWSKPDVLWRMHKDPEFVTDVANQLLAIAKVSEHIIDRLVRNK
jgi:hypothetical protein